MLGIGRWKTRNKVLPGIYINLPSNRGLIEIKYDPYYPDSGDTDETTKSVLGVGVLGKMILGKQV